MYVGRGRNNFVVDKLTDCLDSQIQCVDDDDDDRMGIFNLLPENRMRCFLSFFAITLASVANVNAQFR